MVTPCVGVWIETIRQASLCLSDTSHPAWVCGLKQSRNTPQGMMTMVTPCVGVWIETLKISLSVSSFASSHPAWVCGLKLKSPFFVPTVDVTPCVGVWIET